MGSISSAMGSVTGGMSSVLGVGGGTVNNDLNSILGNKPITPFGNLMAPISDPVASGQLGNSYTQAQDALTQQSNFLTALQGQNGIGNQSAVYNQLSGVASGKGPNPAQAMLAQQTGANSANQAALMAGQRGAGSNTGLIARQAAMQGGANQQQAVGQGATMQAQQALSALNMMGGIAGQQVGQQAAATTGLNQAAQSEQQNLLNAQTQFNAQQVNQYNALNNNNAQVNMSNNTVQQRQGVAGGLVGGLGAALAMNKGGEVQNMSDGGTPTIADENSSSGPQSMFGKFMYGSAPPNLDNSQLSDMGGPHQVDQTPPKGMLSGLMPAFMSKSKQGSNIGSSAGSSTGSEIGGEIGMAKGGKVDAMVSPGEIYLPPKKAHEVAKGKRHPMDGEMIPGKATVKGDSLKNDTVPKTLEEGGIVIPRSVVNSKDAEKKCAAFVAAHLAKHKRGLPRK